MKKTIIISIIAIIFLVPIIFSQEIGYVDCDEEYGSDYICYTSQEWSKEGHC